MFGHKDKSEYTPVANEALIEAFIGEYTMVMTEDEADEVFDYAKLRDFFGCIPLPKQPDSLPPYLTRLQEEGYQFRMSWSGDPSLFVRKLHKQTVHFCPSLEDETTETKSIESHSDDNDSDDGYEESEEDECSDNVDVMQWVDSLLEGDDDDVDEDDNYE